MGAVSEVLKLDCPLCRGSLNLRRIHLGIEGECVHCHKPVTAIEDESGCRLVSSMGIPDSPFPSNASVESSAVPEPSSNPIAEKAPQTAPAPLAEPSQSLWGFPSKEPELGGLHQIALVSFSSIEETPEPKIESEPQSAFLTETESDKPPQLVDEGPFQSASIAAELFQKPQPSSSEIEESADLPPPLPAQKEAAPFSSESTVSFEEMAQGMDVSSPLVEESGPFQSAHAPPPLEALAESKSQSPPPLEPSTEVPATGNVPPALPAALFSSSEGEGSMKAAKNHPLPGGISPFSTGSAKRAEPGLAEALFTDIADSAARPEVPDISQPDDVAFNAANQWGPAPVSTTSDGDELDFSAIAPITQEKAPAADRAVATKMPKKRKSGLGIFKKIFKFFLTIGIIGGIAFAANAFVPEAKWGEWKQQAIDWLEPGSVILDKLPFGKNKRSSAAPAPKVESAIRTRQEIAEELLQVPQHQPGG